MNHFPLVQNLKGVSSLCESYEIFWSEEITKRFQDLYTHNSNPY